MRNKVARFLWAPKMRLKKMQFLSAIKKLASLFPRLQNAKWRETSTDSTVIEPNRSNLNIFCIFQEPLSREKYAYVGLYVNYALGKSSYVSKIPPVLAKNKFKTVSVFLSTLQLTALLLKKFRGECDGGRGRSHAMVAYIPTLHLLLQNLHIYIQTLQGLKLS